MNESPNLDTAAKPAGVRRPPILLWAAGVAAAAVGLLLLLGRVATQGPFSFDSAILLSLRVPGDPHMPIGPGWVRLAMIDITALGGATVLTLVVLSVAALLAARRLWVTALLAVAAEVSGSTMVSLLKVHVGRARPPLVDHLVEAGGMSFPSGHSANSAIVYLTLAALVSQVVRGRATRNAIIAIAVLLVGMIGISRVYLGVHWPSDVLAGWSFGTLWALAWWLAGARVRESAGGG